MSLLTIELLNLSIVVLEVIMLLILANSVFNRRHSVLVTALITSATIPLSYIALSLISENTPLRLLVGVLTLTGWILLCYRVEFIKAVFIAVFFQAYLMLGDSVFLAFLRYFTDISTEQFMVAEYAYFLLCYCIKIAEFLGVAWLSSWLRRRFKQRHAAWADWLRAIFLPVASLVISIYLLKMFNLSPELDKEILTCALIVLAIDVMSIFLLNYLEKQQDVFQDNIILKQSMKAEIDNIAAWKDAYAGQRKQTHDFQNHLLVIRGLVKQQAPQDEILVYLDGLQKDEAPTVMLLYTRRTATDVVLNQKLSIARSKDIRFQTQLDDLSAVLMPDDELVTVLSNLIDNAITACERIPEPEKRFILLKIRIQDSVTFLHIENSTSIPVVIRNNCVVTTKENSREHGYGLKNVTSVLEKYDAIHTLNYRDEEGVFSFSAQVALKR